MEKPDKSAVALATFGGGCFWCLEAAFDALQGVGTVISGYAGGHTANPTYREVCSGTTGHAEVVQISFDPEQISYAELLGVFFAIHDPTTLNRQGNDVGSQYRSVIFTHDAEQDAAARHALAELDAAGIFGVPIVTEIRPCPAFYPAEEYHRDYYARNDRQPYCQAIIAPKLGKLRKHFAAHLKTPTA